MRPRAAAHFAAWSGCRAPVRLVRRRAIPRCHRPSRRSSPSRADAGARGGRPCRTLSGEPVSCALRIGAVPDPRRRASAPVDRVAPTTMGASLFGNPRL